MPAQEIACNSLRAFAQRLSIRSMLSNSSVLESEGWNFSSQSLRIFSFISPQSLRRTFQLSQTASVKSGSRSHCSSFLISSMENSSILHLDSMVLQSSSRRPTSLVSSFLGLDSEWGTRRCLLACHLCESRSRILRGRFVVLGGTQNNFKPGYTLISIIMSSIDYEEDVEQLQRVWRDIKCSSGKGKGKGKAKNVNDSTQCRTNESKGQLNGKKLRVVVSDQNLKKIMKRQDDGVINIITRPTKTNNDPILANIQEIAPEILLLTNPQRQKLIQTENLRRALAEREQEISILRVSNSRYEDKIRQLQAIIEEKDMKVEQLRGRERQLSAQLSALASKDLNFNYGKVQYENYRQDSKRLLKILKTTAEYHYFADFGLKDEGERFLTNANKTVKTKLDASQDTQMHFCSCKKAFIPEAFLWVPEKAYNYGRQFLREHKGQLGQNQIELLLYELNKIWREREKAIISRLTSEKALQIDKLKIIHQHTSQKRVRQE